MRPSAGFWGSDDGSSCMGEGSGGGMFVPSVSEPNLRSRAGSWNLVPVVLVRDGMMGLVLLTAWRRRVEWIGAVVVDARQVSE